MCEVFDVSGYGRALLLFGTIMCLLVIVSLFAWLDFTGTWTRPADPAPAASPAAPVAPHCPGCPGADDPQIHSADEGKP